MPSRRKLWADSLPKSPNTGVAIADNRRFNPDGSIQSKRENEDGYFNCVFNSTSLLLVLDGHDGKRAQEYVKETMPESIVKMVEETVDHDQIKTKFVEIFQTVEKEFFRSIDELLTERAVIKIELDECLNSSVALERYPNHVSRISELDDQIKGGTTAAVAIIKHNKLYVANVGDTRVLLCLVNPQNNYLLVDQLTVDHNTSNEEELRRLKSIGLDPDQLRRVGRLGTQQNTRCIGDFNIKSGYSDHDILRSATKAPGIALPHVAGPIVINQARGFIIVMSDGLYDAWSAFMDQNTSNANIAIARMVAEQIRGKQNMEVVAQTVIDSVVSSVRYTYANSQKNECRRLDDITLMIHNLGYDASDYPLSGIVNFPLATAPVPTVPPPPPPSMNTYLSQPGGFHQGQPFDNVHQGVGHQPIQHMAQSYDPRYIGSQAPARSSQVPMYTPTPTPHYQQPPMTTRENPFVFPSSQQPVSHVSQPPLPPQVQYSQPGGQEHPSTNYNQPPNQTHGITNHSRGTSPSNYVPTNLSTGYNHSSSYNSSYSTNMPTDGNQGLNYSGSSANTSLVNPPQYRQDVGRLSTSPVPPSVDYPTSQAQQHPQQSQPHPQQAPGNRSGSSTHLQSTSDEDGEATPVADPSGKEVFPQPGKKPVPPPRKVQPSGESLSTLTNAFQSLSTSGGTEIPPPQSSSTPTKENDSQPRIRDSFDASNLKDEELYGDDDGDKDTLEVPVQGSGEVVELKPGDNQPEPELPKSSEGSQLDQYIFDSDGEMEKQFEGHSDDEIDDDDDDDMGVVDASMLSSVLTGEEPTQNIVRSYIKFDNFPDLWKIEYDAL